VAECLSSRRPETAEGIRKLEREGVNHELRGNSGRSAFSQAAGGGGVGLLKLLERGEVNAQSRDEYGCAQLTYAAGV